MVPYVALQGNADDIVDHGDRFGMPMPQWLPPTRKVSSFRF